MSLNLLRQTDILSTSKLEKASVSLIGAGAIGSFTALSLTKMGLQKLDVWDEDGVTDHNLPNQFFRITDIRQFKVFALQNTIREFNGVTISPRVSFYKSERLQPIVIVATDSMSSRRLVWNQFKKQKQCKWFIDARMGAELCKVYLITKKDTKFYEETLHSDEKAVQLKCTAKAIIYNVLMASCLVCRAVKAVINGEIIPKEQIFNMQEINKASFMVRG
jgi:hypothetical protein